MLNEFRYKMLNREASSPKNKPLEIIENLNLYDEMVVGDIGSGGGYFTHEFSRKVGRDGQVYAIDTDEKALDFIKNHPLTEDIQNVETLRVNPNGINLPEESVDLFFLRNVFHHIPNQAEYFKGLEKLLKEDGKIAIIDYNKRKLSFTGLFGHYTPEIVLLDIMKQAGFSLQEKYDFLPDQLFMVFEKWP
ncbi:class I SAM-dependent methyltransferase [Methanobacterium formicicum]|uniref:Type 11 methyltransferase n=1 Tax=Methanobacterium formicicum (strain DSM 3637 / PP1) TaxID=1204725 RepID=K2R680_METFP|nr:methyltransferase domain-containing protein [Methanobacterium formicicum]EKF86747.1 type 11 methyltransferase [Methanobacterium formicicum DSM 3637]